MNIDSLILLDNPNKEDMPVRIEYIGRGSNKHIKIPIIKMKTDKAGNNLLNRRL